jgi:RND family efflux transporter MFP subunit
MTLPARRVARPLLLAGALVLTVLAQGCKTAAPPAEEKIPPAPVKWENPRRFILSEWTELVGTTQPLPDRAARITAPVEGRVLSVLKGADGKAVVEGQRVHKGDVIAQLDATIVRANRDSEEAHHKITKEEVEQARSAVKLATIEVKRLKSLKADSPKLVTAVEQEKADVALEDVQSKLRGAERKLEAGDQTLAALNEQLSLYTLKAPIDGRLGRIQVVPGQTLPIGTLVTDVLDVGEKIDVLCFVPAKVARQLQVGMKAQVGGLDRDAGGGEASGTEGTVAFIAEQAEPDTGNFAVKVQFPNNKDARLPVNAVVQVRVQTKPEKECFAIPEAALMEDSDPPTVVIVELLQVTQKEVPVKDLPKPVGEALKKDYPGADLQRAEEIVKKSEGLPGGNWEEKIYKVQLVTASKEPKEVFYDPAGQAAKDEQLGVARRLQAVIGIRDRVLHQVELLRIEDPEKKWQGDVESALIVTEKGQGLQTGDRVKLQVDDDD